MALSGDTRNTPADQLVSARRPNGQLDLSPIGTAWARPSDSEAGAFERLVGDTAVPNNAMASTEKQLEYVLNCAEYAGFDSFDDLVTAYYTSKFDDACHLFFEQRQSRNRRLPGVLAEVRRSSMTWTQWEKQGYSDEVLKAAESILVKEFRSFVCSRSVEERMRDLKNLPEPIGGPVNGAPHHSQQSEQSQCFNTLLSLQRSFYSEVSRQRQRFKRSPC
jgi:hypothetical protein